MEEGKITQISKTPFFICYLVFQMVKNVSIPYIYLKFGKYIF